MFQTMFKKRSEARKMRPMGLPRAATWVLLGLILGTLFGCASPMPTIRIVSRLPPQELLADCPTVAEKLSTNGGLAETILAYRASLSTCTIDKHDLREWVEKNQ